jgi:small multidrug resistance family-3 protein
VVLEKYTALVFLIAATVMEASGDAIVRIGLSQPSWPLKISLFAGGATLLFGYGLALNLAPLEFGRVVGLYIATLFVVWQIVNFVSFRSTPTLPILTGGALIVLGGEIVSFWPSR